MSHYYAGIGSRETPTEVLKCMHNIGKKLALTGWCLRSGGANGADSAFETGCDVYDGCKEIYVPWQGFNGSNSPLYNQTYGALLLAESLHPDWNACQQADKKLHVCSIYQILGEDLDTPVEFVVCYTKGGKRTGGTGQALRLAEILSIPIYDFGVYSSPEEAEKHFFNIVS